jgi:dTDP-4-dehydrorhamnose 3,5-epimerase/CDP-3, 6-dideoxy-D-glycero-D-glycero-4-hexulose-5-epimerase
MNLIQTPFSDLYLLQPNIINDSRGQFIKTFNKEFFLQIGLDITIKESYYSISHLNVIRGMHFQTPPHEHTKLVYVSHGKITDVVLDIRKNSPTYGKFFDIELSAQNGMIIVIPTGFAHGFKSIEADTIVHYMQTTSYAPKHDCGLHHDSFGYDWKTENPILSERDHSFQSFDEFKTPFIGSED